MNVQAYNGGVSEDFPLVFKSINATNVMKHIDYLSNLPNSSLPSRFTGYPGFYQAADYIIKTLQSYGYNVTLESFLVTVPMDKGAKITLLDEKGQPTKVIKAFPLLPNSVSTCTTPPGGVEGKLIYAKTGELKYYNDKKVNGSIVLLDYNSRYFWKYAVMLGARGIIFIAPKTTTRIQSELKSLKIPLNIPRLYISAKDGQLLKELAYQNVTVRIESKVEWVNVPVQNIVASVIGREAPYEKVVLTAYYDSYSSVPSIAPGATEAINVGLLLELARFFSTNVPYRTIEFVFLAGHNQALWGAREFVNKHFNEVGTVIRIFASIDLSDESNYISVCARGSTYQYVTLIESTRHSWISSLIDRYSRDLTKMGEKINYINAIFPRIPFYEAAPLLFDSDPFTLAGGVGITFHTTNSIRSRQWTPTDHSELIDLNNLIPQFKFVAACAYGFANEMMLQVAGAPTKIATDWGFASLRVIIGKYNLTKAFYDPYENPDSIIHIQWPQVSPLAGRGIVTQRLFETTFDAYIKPTEDGSVVSPRFSNLKNVSFLFHGVKPYTTVKVEAYVVNRTTGNVEYATDLGIYGLGAGYPVARQGPTIWIKQEVNTFWAPLFKCASIVLLNIIDPTTSTTTAFSIQNFYHRAHSWNLQHCEDVFETDAVAFIPPGVPTELIITYAAAAAGAAMYGGAGGATAGGGAAQAEARYPLAVLANMSETFPEGIGYVLKEGTQLIIYNTPFEIARQLLLLTGQRIGLLSAYHTRNILIEQFYPLAQMSFRAAEKAKSNLQHEESVAYSIAAWSYAHSAYGPSMAFIIDVINTVVFFFLLSIPFAYLLEMLLFPQLRGFKKLLSFIILLLICIFILSLFHPGFHVATNVYIIILSTTVGVIGLLVVGKTISEALTAAEIQRERLLGAHVMSYSRVEAMSMAFSTGIQNMRRRKMRTSLMLISLIVMTASLVTLTSASLFSTTIASKIEGKTPYIGILIRDPNFAPQAELMEQVLDAVYSKEGVVSPRTWLTQQHGFILKEGVSIRAIFGLTSEEKYLTGIDKALVKGRWIMPIDRYVCVLPKSLANDLDVTVGDHIRWLGLNLSVIGIVDDLVLSQLSDLDQLTFAPVLFQEGALIQLPPKEYIIVPYDLMISEILTTPYSIGIRIENKSKILPIADELSKQTLRLNIYAGLGDYTMVFSAITLYGVSGVTWLMVPIIIVGLTILNMMIAAVYERLKEISVYTAVGLNPMHISSLFLSESVLYAVVGSMIGYVVSMTIVGIMDTFGLTPPGFYVNYASTFVVVAVVSTMVTTLLASIYPSSKASKLSVPSLRRKWRIPTTPKGDEWFVPLPFVASEEESGGILEYLKEYIDASRGTYGEFASESSEMIIKPEFYGVLSTMRLAPYDLGIIQRVMIRAVKQTENLRGFEIHIHRLGGHVDSWTLSNRVFLDLIRKQFLYWRALSTSQKNDYIRRFRERKGER